VDGIKKIRWLSIVGAFAFLVKATNDFIVTLPKLPFLTWVPHLKGLEPSLRWAQLGLSFDPSPMMFGYGIIMGLRSGLSLLIGALICWGGLVPFLIYKNWITINDPGSVFAQAVSWTLWPGVGMMVTSSLASFLFNLHMPYKNFGGSSNKQKSLFLNWKFYTPLSLLTMVLVYAQFKIFQVSPVMGLLAVAFSLLLGVVSSRVSGETGIPPIGALGKVTQLTFGFLNPGQITTNLMTANVTGGAAGQSSDLLHDLKAGLLLKINYQHQVLTQVFGVVLGALVGTGVYLLLIPDPQSLLITEQWPAPAVATWKAVAEVVAKGADHFPPHAEKALVLGSLLGLVGALVEKVLRSKKLKNWMPSSASMGLAFMIPGWTSITMGIAALLTDVVKRRWPNLANQWLFVIAAGLVSGESLAGVLGTFFSALN
jgi:uncharacterized oligopeptide transporter (OPT) family protein